MICCLSRNFDFELDSIDLISPVAPSLEDNTLSNSYDELVQATSSAKLRMGSVLLNNYDAPAVLPGTWVRETEQSAGVNSFPKARKAKVGVKAVGLLPMWRKC
jgi:hypothetical protein